jgi:hypothetical protein
VSNPTKQCHLRGQGTTALRARVLAETKLLGGIREERNEQQPGQSHTKPGSKKRSSSNSDQAGSRKRLNTSQLEASLEPDNSSTFHAEADPVDPYPVVVTQPSNVERTRHAIEQRWGARCNNDGGDVEDDDETDQDEGEDMRNDEDNDEDGEGEGEGEGEDEGEGEGEDEDEDDEDDEPNMPGLSAWDLLGEDFEREAAAIG